MSVFIVVGTTSGVNDYIALELSKSGLFELIFGNGYHLSLMVPPILLYLRLFLSQVVIVSACMEDLFKLLGKADCLPSISANAHLMMLRDVTVYSDAKVTEYYASAKNINHKLGVEEYRVLGIGIGGAPKEQRQKLGADEYQRQVEFGIGIVGGTSKEQHRKWGRLKYQH